MIPGFRGGVGVSRNFPAAEMLRADRELEGLAGVGGEFVEVGGHLLGVV